MSTKDSPNKLLVVIAGPTASGKTEVAIQLAREYQTGIVSADSRQLYKELNIGVGKPTPEQLALVPHHMIGIISINDHYSAGHFTQDALKIIYSLFATHDIVFLTGGTGLYIKSIVDGLDSMPVVPDDVIAHWTAVWEKEGVHPLIDFLKEKDPVFLSGVDQQNHSRLIRAVSVTDYSGIPFSAFRKGEKTNHLFSVLPIVLDIPRKELYERINQRVLDMIDQGWMNEARELFPHRHLKALQTVGYKELFEVIDGKSTLEEAIPKIQQSTRRYAKRQLTWFRNQGEWKWMSPSDLIAIKDFITPNF